MVFGFWAIVLVAVMAAEGGVQSALDYAESRNYTEPKFVFVVMVIAASRPVLVAVSSGMKALAHVAPIQTPLAFCWLGLSVVPLLGSLITEPAAMTIAALMLAPTVFSPVVAERTKYFMLGALFVNVSIGGTLTAYAAPPVLMAGVGLTVIANAPNPAGVALLKRGFADESIGAGGRLLGALLPTAVAAAAFLVV